MDLIIADYPKATELCNTLLGEKYFPFCLSYVPGDYNFREIDRFRWESRHMCTRFKNHYDGPVAIDLTQWADQHPNSYFEAFFYYLKDHYKESQCVLLSEKPCGAHITEKLEAFYPLTITDKLHPEENGKQKRIIGFAITEEERCHV